MEQEIGEFVSARAAARLLGYAPRSLTDPRTRRRIGLKAYRVMATGTIRFKRDEVLSLLQPENFSGQANGDDAA